MAAKHERYDEDHPPVGGPCKKARVEHDPVTAYPCKVKTCKEWTDECHDCCKQHRSLPRCGNLSCRSLENLTNFAMPTQAPVWRCSQHFPPPCPPDVAKMLPKTQDDLQRWSRFLQYSRQVVEDFVGDRHSDANAVELALYWATQNAVVGKCQGCGVQTFLHEEGSLRKCKDCTKLLNFVQKVAAEKKNDSEWILIFQIPAGLLDVPKSSREQVFHNLCSMAMVWSGIERLGDGKVIPADEQDWAAYKRRAEEDDCYDSRDTPLYTLVYRCAPVTELSQARLANLRPETAWEKMAELKTPDFPLRPFVPLCRINDDTEVPYVEIHQPTKQMIVHFLTHTISR